MPSFSCRSPALSFCCHPRIFSPASQREGREEGFLLQQEAEDPERSGPKALGLLREQALCGGPGLQSSV